MSPELIALADGLHQARQGGPTLPPHPGLTLAEGYHVAAHNHRRRVAAGDATVGRKVGHTQTANWATLGIQAPSWGWLYASTTWRQSARSVGAGWREPKVELELVLRLCQAPPADADEAALLPCIEAVALGLEFVDRPYPAWGGSVADSVAAGGVHAGLWIGEPQPWSHAIAAALPHLSAELQVGSQGSQGGSGGVMGSPLRALAALQRVLTAQSAPALQAGEWISTGALAPALPYATAVALSARVMGPGFSLSV